MKFRLLFLLLLTVPGVLYAYEKTDSKDKCPDKNKTLCKRKADPNNIEDFVFLLPSQDKGACLVKKEFHQAVVDFYKWYLQNEEKISVGLSGDNKRKDLIPPFNISWQTLHDYFELVQKKYPKWIENPLPSVSSANDPGGTSENSIDFTNLAK